MPFQALPIALRTNTGDPLSKLLWAHLVHRAILDDAPNGMAYAEIETRSLAAFCQCSDDQVIEAVERLQRLQLLGVVLWRSWEPEEHPERKDEAFIDVVLPISQLRSDERKRIKASPDEIESLAEKQEHTCATCGDYYAPTSAWHVDHIIPRSKGGADVASNCQVLCGRCNSRKGAKMHFVDFLGGRQ